MLWAVQMLDILWQVLPLLLLQIQYKYESGRMLSKWNWYFSALTWKNISLFVCRLLYSIFERLVFLVLFVKFLVFAKTTLVFAQPKRSKYCLARFMMISMF